MGYNSFQFMQGRVSTPDPQDSTGQSLSVGAYSECGILESSPAPLSSFPRTFRDMNLQQIAEEVCAPAGIGVSFDFDPGARFDKVELTQTQNVLPFLSGLAVQRNFVISDDQLGNLIFWRGENVGTPILEIDDDNRPDATVQVKFDDSKYYSSVTGTVKTKTKKKGASFTVQNPFFNGIVRPYNFEVERSSAGELETVVNAAAGRMFAGVFKATVTLPDWKDRNGDIIDRNRPIRLRSPSKYMTDWVDLITSGVDLSNNKGSEAAQIECVLPEAYSGEIPESVFWA
jgi:prophage tail gpP-like protein